MRERDPATDSHRDHPASTAWSRTLCSRHYLHEEWLPTAHVANEGKKEKHREKKKKKMVLTRKINILWRGIFKSSRFTILRAFPQECQASTVTGLGQDYMLARRVTVKRACKP